MTQVRVGVIRGGVSNEYDVSLKTGAAVLRNLPPQYKSVDIFLDKYGEWYIGGRAITPERALLQVDVLFNALHGYYGEDGKIQKLLDHFKVPYTGSKVLASALGMNKALSKDIFRQKGLRTPYHQILKKQAYTPSSALRMFRSFPQPAVVKPLSGGSSVGVSVTKDFDSFNDALRATFAHSHTALIEEYIGGREATCGVVDHFRDVPLYALPPTEIIPPPDSGFYNYDVKYNGMTRKICPANFSKEEKQEIMRMAVVAHQALGARHYSRSDFVVSPRGIYILELNTLPGLTEESNLPKECEAVGLLLPDFLEHVIELARKEK